MTSKAQFVTEVTVVDPESRLPVEVSIYKDLNSGGLFGVDGSFLSKLPEGGVVTEPFNNTDVVLIGD